MINTSAFESLERYLRLERAYNALVYDGTSAIPAYAWMVEGLKRAMVRELEFAKANQEYWKEKEDDRR